MPEIGELTVGIIFLFVNKNNQVMGLGDFP
jgi:hypothetical protein